MQDDISHLCLDVAHLIRSNQCMEVAMTKRTSLTGEVLNVKLQCVSVDLLRSDHIGAHGEETPPIEGVCIPGPL